MKCNETLSKWCKNKHGASKIIDTFDTYHGIIKFWYCQIFPAKWESVGHFPYAHGKLGGVVSMVVGFGVSQVGSWVSNSTGLAGSCHWQSVTYPDHLTARGDAKAHWPVCYPGF
jgi:hypothetical protein